MTSRSALLLTTALAAFVTTAVWAADLAPSILVLPDIEVVSRRLDQARSQLQPGLGATVYEFSRGAIENLPQGDNSPFNATLLQAPGVAQDSFGQIHVRGDHNEVQFRLDGVQLPEGLAVFGQTLQTRFADSVSLITGSLPAQYGFDTAAVVDITTKSGRTDPGGEISIYGGARDYLQPSLSYGGSVGAIDYFFSGDVLHSRVGIENPDSSFNPVHDLSNQTHGLAHVSGLLDSTTRVSLLAGVSNEFFQIPNNPGQTPQLGLTANGVSDFNSLNLNQHQREITDQRWTGSAGAAYKLFADSNHPARLSADLLVGSGLRADGDVPNGRALPGYYTVNLAAVQTITTGYIGQTQLRLDVINLLDRKYEIRDGTGVGVGAPQFGLRRTILAGLAQKF